MIQVIIATTKTLGKQSSSTYAMWLRRSRQPPTVIWATLADYRGHVFVLMFWQSA
jgi:hypothetical protein